MSDLLRAATVLFIPIGDRDEHPPRLPARVPPDHHLDLLPAGARRDPAPDRPAGRAADGELGVVGRRDAGRRHRLPAGRALRRRPGLVAADRVLARRGDLRGLGPPPEHDRRPCPRGARATGAETEAAPSGKPIDSMVRDVQTVLEAPVPEPVQAPVAAAVAVDDAPGFVGELKAGWRFLRGDPVLLANTVQAAIAQLTVGRTDRPDAGLRQGDLRRQPAWLGGCLRLHRDRPAAPAT